MQILQKPYYSFPIPKSICSCTGTILLINSFLLFNIGAAQSKFAHNHNIPNYYKKGLEEMNKGNFEKSLAIWEEAVAELKEPDFRISQSYIELVVDRELRQKYQKASEIYEWGLAGELEADEKDFVLKELSFLRSLIGNGEYKDLKKVAENENSTVLIKIKNFWEGLDPTPLSSYNERLLEHWQRINYARQNYTKKNSDEFDDRAFIYLKYGEPYYNKKGQLNYLSAFVNRLLKEGIQPPSFASNNQLAITSTQRMNLEKRIRQYHSYPRYEIWIYRRLTDDLQNTIFLFGTRDGVSSFRKIQSIEDFIPNEAYRIPAQNNYSFSNSNVSRGDESRDEVRSNTFSDASGGTPKVNISPALILQLMYYEQFAALDAYFGNAYNEMMDRFITASNIGSNNMKVLAREFGTIYGSKLIHIQNNAPAEKSEYEAEIMDLPGKIYSYRFLDEKNMPYVKIFSVTQFEEALYYDLLKETNTLQTNIVDRYILLSGYQVRDKLGEQLLEEKDEENVHSLDKIVKVFDIPYKKNSESILISHELHTTGDRDDSLLSARSPYPKSLKGLSKHKVEFSEPLDRNELALSDVILGYSSNEEIGSALSADSLNFMIAHTKEIPQGSALNLYYELYNLETKGSSGIAEYTFKYSIKGDEEGFLGLGKSDDEKVTITINNTVASSRDENTISINTSEYEKGEYELSITITDINTGETYSNVQKFSIQ